MGSAKIVHDGDAVDDPLSAPRVAAIARLSAVDTVRARITMAISLGLLRPNDRLPSTAEMAESFGVSASSVDRGLIQLHDEGVIVRRAGRYGGSFVTGRESHTADGPVQRFLDDRSRVHALIDERAMLEAGFAALAARHRDAAELAQLRTLVAEMAETESWAIFRNCDRAFHRLVTAAARVPQAEELAARLNVDLDPYYLPYEMGLLHDSNDEHVRIVDALESGDAGSAALLTAAHVQGLHTSMYVGLGE